MKTQKVLTVLADSRIGRLSRRSPQFGPDGLSVRRSTWKCLARRGSVVLDAQSVYVAITDAGRRRVALLRHGAR